MAYTSIRSVCLAASALLCAGTAWALSAAGDQAADLAPMPGGEFSWWGYVRALGVLFLALGALWAALWLLRRSGRFAGMPRTGSLPRDALYLEGHLGLGPHKGLMVVRFLNKRLLLGVTEHQITLLTETDPDDVPHPSQSKDFQSCLDNDVQPDAPALAGARDSGESGAG